MLFQKYRHPYSSSSSFSITVSVLILFLATFLFPRISTKTLLAQTAGGTSWGGVILNSADKGLSGATVQLESPAGKMSTKTGADGRFEFPSLLQSSYKLSVIVKGQSAAYEKALVL